ncbi:MAG: hypothetical protein K6E59_03040 [Bacilli bacterium]|nr:hypothetical protein [Bacilli bacterium]
MNIDEEKLEKNEPETESLPVEDDVDGFTDEVKFEEPKPEEAPEEAKSEEKAEEEPPVIVEEPEPEPENPDLYNEEFDDERLSAIEESRQKWNKSYKKMSMIKFIVSTAILLGILAGWLIPTFLLKDASVALLPLYIGLGCAVVGIAILLIFGFFQRKHDKEQLRNHFNVYFDSVNSYTLGEYGVTDLHGDVDDKISKEEFLESGVFENVASVGSRDNITFSYKGMDCALAEAAAQKDGGKALATIFVGKFLRTHNTVSVSDDGLVIYYPGNDRALPPEKLDQLHLAESSRAFKIYGSAADKKVLTKKVRDALHTIRTNKLLVDVTLVIKPGRTYWYLGYEDDIMVLPGEKPFNPRFVKQYKDELKLILDASLTLNE